jgi:hypothetical protein
MALHKADRGRKGSGILAGEAVSNSGVCACRNNREDLRPL